MPNKLRTKMVAAVTLALALVPSVSLADHCPSPLAECHEQLGDINVHQPDGTLCIRIHIRPEIAKGGRAGDVLLSDAQLSLRRSDFVHLLGLVDHGIGDLE